MLFMFTQYQQTWYWLRGKNYTCIFERVVSSRLGWGTIYAVEMISRKSPNYRFFYVIRATKPPLIK